MSSGHFVISKDGIWSLVNAGFFIIHQTCIFICSYWNPLFFFLLLFFPTVDGTSFYTGTKHRFSRVPLMMLNMFLGNQRNLFLALLKLLSTLLNVVLGRLIGVKH